MSINKDINDHILLLNIVVIIAHALNRADMVFKKMKDIR